MDKEAVELSGSEWSGGSGQSGWTEANRDLGTVGIANSVSEDINLLSQISVEFNWAAENAAALLSAKQTEKRDLMISVASSEDCDRIDSDDYSAQKDLLDAIILSLTGIQLVYCTLPISFYNSIYL